MTAPVQPQQPLFDMWAAIPAAQGARNGWSLVAQRITFEQAKVYKATFLFQVKFMQHQER